MFPTFFQTYFCCAGVELVYLSPQMITHFMNTELTYGACRFYCHGNPVTSSVKNSPPLHTFQKCEKGMQT